MSDPRTGPLCSAALAFPYDRHKPSCFLPLLCYIVYMSWRSVYTGPVSLCRYSPHPSRGQKPLSLLAVADNSNGCSLHPSRGQRKKRQEANASCLRLSKKWLRHFFESGCTQANPRFLAKKSGCPAREVSFPTHMLSEMTDQSLIPPPAGGGTPCGRAFLTS